MAYNYHMRWIMHLDMNSFFATVEQQANPFLRGRAIGVSGRPGSRSIVAAASIEAKRGGVKTAMGTAEALAANPQLRLVVGSNLRYRSVSRQVVAIVLRYTPDVEVFSIDECFLDLTSVVQDGLRHGQNGWQVASDIACSIKAAIRTEIGEYISCSVGIASNKFLAKLASDLFKPDGLHLVADDIRLAHQVRVAATGPRRTRLLVNQTDALLLATPPGEFCGLGPRLARHLARIGIVTTADLRSTDVKLLRRILGVVGQQLYDYAWGRDDRPLQQITEPPLPQSFSHALTLPVTDYTPALARSYLSGLAEKVASRMRRSGMAARQISCFVRFGMYSGWGGHRTVRQAVRDGPTIFALADEIFNRCRSFQPIRMVGIGLRLVQPVSELTLPLLPEEQRIQRIVEALDLINNRFGDGVAVQARTLLSKGRQSEATHAFGSIGNFVEADGTADGAGGLGGIFNYSR